MTYKCTIAACVLLLATTSAAAQEQTIIVDQPLAACPVPASAGAAGGSVAAAAPPTAKRLTEEQAAGVIKQALGAVEDKTHYILHVTEFVRGRMVVAEESWYVYYAPWTKKGALWWFRDANQFKHFRELRIFGGSRVGLVYLYLNVPAYQTRSIQDKLMTRFRARRQEELNGLPSDKERQARIVELDRSLRAGLTREEESDALGSKEADPNTPPTIDILTKLEVERYFKAFGKGDSTVKDEVKFIDSDNGEELVGLSSTLATTSTFAQLSTLFYKVAVTKKIPAPVENLKAAAKLAFGAQAAADAREYVEAPPSPVCAGRYMDIRHLPSNLKVDALLKKDRTSEVEVLKSTQTFDNEGKYFWDVSFGLPLQSRSDLTINVDDGQVAAKKVQKTDLFALINLGLPRDTKRLQWQLVPTFVYGTPITGKPLKHHLVGFTIGLNYVQLLGGFRFDRRIEVSTGVENGTPVGIEATPPTEKWSREWVWGVNIPVKTVVQLLTKSAK